MSEHIFFAYEFDGKGGGVRLEGDAIARRVKEDVLAWVSLDADHPDTQGWLEREISYLNPAVIEALLEDVTRPRMSQIGDGVLLILRGVNLTKDSDPEDMVSLRMWVDRHRIISIRRQRVHAVEDLVRRLEAGKGPKDAGEFISLLPDLLIGRIDTFVDKIESKTDTIEDEILDEAVAAHRPRLAALRRETIIFRRHMAPQRDALHKLLSADMPWFSAQNRNDLNVVYNQAVRCVEDLDAVRERTQIVKDELSSILAEKLNRNMYILSVIAAIFLPLGFLTGLLGINVAGIPGAESKIAFYVFCLILALVVGLQIMVFKRNKWF